MIKKTFLTLVIICMVSCGLWAQSDYKSYNVEANAKEQIAKAVSIAATQNKHVFLMIGGNWCKWCKWFDKFRSESFEVDSLLKADYVFEHINFSKENKNIETMKALDFPQRFGFPVFVILDSSGKRIHTQQTDYLEQGEGYNQEKVTIFLKQWSSNALKPEQYLK
jgi:thioredoxin-related protein